MQKLLIILLIAVFISPISAPRKKGAPSGRPRFEALSDEGGTGIEAAHAGAESLGIKPKIHLKKPRIRNKYLLGSDIVAQRKIEDVRSDPEGMLEPLVGDLDGCFKLKTGGFRTVLTWTHLNELTIQAYNARSGVYDMSVPIEIRERSKRIYSIRKKINSKL